MTHVNFEVSAKIFIFNGSPPPQIISNFEENSPSPEIKPSFFLLLVF